MQEPIDRKPQYVVRLEAIRKAIQHLAERRSHNHLPGYLALLRRRLTSGVQGMHLSDIEEFHADYLQVSGAPAKKPYIQPFRSRGTGVLLLNRNLQGSYAPSSIRPDQPLSKVVRLQPDTSSGGTSGRNTKYELVDNHAEIVLSEMLAGNKIPAVSLAIFLFRERSLELPNGEIQDLIAALRSFFRIRQQDNDGDEIFDLLFMDDGSDFSKSDLKQLRA